jgi:hypothetical protein
MRTDAGIEIGEQVEAARGERTVEQLVQIAHDPLLRMKAGKGVSPAFAPVYPGRAGTDGMPMGLVARDALDAAPKPIGRVLWILIDGEIDQGRGVSILYSLRKIVPEKSVKVSGSCAQVQFNGGKQ